MTDEHIIPSSLGGRLVVAFLCKACNDDLGSRVEAQVKTDPAIRLRVQALREAIPNLAVQLEEGQVFVARSPRGFVKGRMKDGEFRVRAATLDDGSLIQHTPDGREHIRRVLERHSGMSPEEIAARLQAFDGAAENVLIPIGSDVAAIKWSIDEVQPALDAPLVSELALLKIAYEFLACHLYHLAYEANPALDEIRSELLGQKTMRTCCRVERLRTPRTDALHGLAFEGNHPHVVVQVRLFGSLAYRVHLPRLAVGGHRLQYTHVLDSGEESIYRLE